MLLLSLHFVDVYIIFESIMSDNLFKLSNLDIPLFQAPPIVESDYG